MSSDIPKSPEELAQLFGAIDVYLFDQLLRGNLRPGMRVLDAGCGGGRNLVFLLRAGYDVCAVDADLERIGAVREMANRLAPTSPSENFRAASIAELPFPDQRFDAVLSNAVLHFSDDEAQFTRMLDEMWRVLAPGGLLWARLATSIGIEDRIRPVGKGWYALPDGSDRFLLDEAELLAQTERLGGRLLDPIKTTNVQGLRCMTTWVVRKPG